MGGLISMIMDPINSAVKTFTDGIGSGLGTGLTPVIKLFSEGLTSITAPGWTELGEIVKKMTEGHFFTLPDKAIKEFEATRVAMKPWFELPLNITANMNTVTSIMEYLSSPIYVLIIISCIFLSVLIIRGLFKSVQDCLDTWFYFERNEQHMRLPGGPADEAWLHRYSCWRRLLTCFYRRRIYVTDLAGPHVPDMVKRYEEKNLQGMHI